MRTTIGLAGAAALTLAACGQGGDAADPGGKAAATAKATASAGAPDGPTPGLWRITTRMSGMPAEAAPPPIETCIREAKFEAPKGPTAEAGGMNCEQQTFRREGDVMVGRSVCTTPDGVRTVTDMRVTGDLARRYQMEMKSTITPAPTPSMGAMTMTMTAERLGDCPASAAQ